MYPLLVCYLHENYEVTDEREWVYFFYYIPVGLDIPVNRRTNITYLLTAVCVIMFFVYRYRPQCGLWDVYNLLFQPLAPSIATAVSYAFLHGGFLHLIGNIVYLVVFGRAVEDRFGPARFYLIFIASALAGAYTHLFFTGTFMPEYLAYPVIGASGATSGLLGAFMIRCSFSRVRVAYWIFMPLQGVNRAGRSYVPVVFAVVFWLILQGVYTMMQLGAGAIQVAYSLHIGGFAAGMLLALLFGGSLASRAEKCIVKAKRHVAEADWFAAQIEYGGYLELAPDDPDAHAAIGRTYVCTSEQGMARYHFIEAIRFYMSEGSRDLAEKVFAEAMRHIPGFTLDERLHLDLAYGMERTLKFRSAASAYENYVGRFRESGEVPFVLLRMAGLLEKRFHKPAEALSCYRAIVENHCEDAWVDFAKAEIDRLERDRIFLSDREEEGGPKGMK
jgi:membrane associated rhomboid family serine protease